MRKAVAKKLIEEDIWDNTASSTKEDKRLIRLAYMNIQ